jgi:hypothetical protein
MTTILCPLCAEEVPAQTTKCPHCGSALAPSTVVPTDAARGTGPHATERDSTTSKRSTRNLWFVIGAVLATALVGAAVLVRLMSHRWERIPGPGRDCLTSALVSNGADLVAVSSGDDDSPVCSSWWKGRKWFTERADIGHAIVTAAWFAPSGELGASALGAGSGERMWLTWSLSGFEVAKEIHGLRPFRVSATSSDSPLWLAGDRLARIDGETVETGYRLESGAFHAVWNVGPQDSWLLLSDPSQGIGESVYLLHYDGARFTKVPLDAEWTGGVMEAGFAGTGPDDVWLYVDNFGGALYHYDGRTWSRQKVDSGDEKWAFHGIAVTGRNDVWLAGHVLKEDTPGIIVHYDGASWTVDSRQGPTLDGIVVHGSGLWTYGIVAGEGTVFFRRELETTPSKKAVSSAHAVFQPAESPKAEDDESQAREPDAGPDSVGPEPFIGVFQNPWTPATVEATLRRCTADDPGVLETDVLCNCFVRGLRKFVTESDFNSALAAEGWPLRASWSREAYGACLMNVATREYADCVKSMGGRPSGCSGSGGTPLDISWANAARAGYVAGEPQEAAPAPDR